eukprot:gene5094-12898_t
MSENEGAKKRPAEDGGVDANPEAASAGDAASEPVTTSEPDTKRVRRDSELDRPKKLRIAVVCSSNQNRSMEAHLFLDRAKFQVQSFGTGNHVKIPGMSKEEPKKWKFGEVSYDEMYKELETEDKDFYGGKGMLKMLDRNRGIKQYPERFQESPDNFDIVITCEGRVYDQTLEHFEEREQESFEQVHVCNVEIKDNHEEATLGAHRIVQLCEMLEKSEDLENEIEDVLASFDEKHEAKHPAVLHSVCFY